MQKSNNMRRIKKIHLVGIGGSGMGGIAEVLLRLGYEVSGSDISSNTTTQHLTALGITIQSEHKAENVQACDVVVVSSAIPKDNPELQAAKLSRIPIVARALMLAELMRFKQGIAIAGAHGKTTTTSLIAFIFAEGGLDPTFVVGGRLNSFGTHARLGEGRYFIAEADESDASFLHLYPMISVVTNIDSDHLEAYNHDYAQLKATYLDFIHQLPFYGLAVLCHDDAEIMSILPQVSRPFLTYGFSNEADYFATDFRQDQTQSYFTVNCPKRELKAPITLNLAGRHNVLNALAAIVVGLEEGIPIDKIQAALQQFAGINRRFSVLGEFDFKEGSVMLIDDYGHHPRELEVVLETIKAGWPDRRLLMVFQPQRYTRTKALFEDFASILSRPECLVLLEVYSAGEAFISGADGRTLARSIRARGRVDPVFVANNDQLTEVVSTIMQPGDIILMQGAGNIGRLALDFQDYLTKR